MIGRVEASQNRALGLAVAALSGQRLSGLQVAKIERAMRLLPHARAALSDFEADMVETAFARLRDQRDGARFTENEWHVIDTSIDAMDTLLGGGRG